LDPGVHGARCAWAMAVHHAVGISRQRNSGYRPSRVNIVAQGLCAPDPSLSPTHLSIRRGRATTTHYTHHQVSLVVSRITTLVRSLGLRIGPACEAGLSAGMRRESVSPQIRKKERSPTWIGVVFDSRVSWHQSSLLQRRLHHCGLTNLRSAHPSDMFVSQTRTQLRWWGFYVGGMMLLLELSGTVFLFICTRHPSVEDNSELGWKPIFSTSLWERPV